MKSLKNHRGGSFCEAHEIEYKNRCKVVDCTRPSIPSTKACRAHQSMWNKYVESKSRSKLYATRRALRHANDLQAWQNLPTQHTQPHDEAESEASTLTHYFGPKRIYVTETLVGSCGVPLAWTTFPTSESPTEIANWLHKLYPPGSRRPSFIAIDKSCQVCL